MNLQSMLLIGLLMGNNVATDIEYYEDIYIENHEQQQKEMYLQRAQESPQNIEALTNLGDYYRDLWIEDQCSIENFGKAESIYKEIIEINPESTVLAEFYMTIEKCIGYYCVYEEEDNDNKKIELYRRAEEEFLRLLEIDNNNIDMMINLADFYANYYTYSDYLSEYHSVIDPLTNLEPFSEAEKLYFDILNVDKNNIEVKEKLIHLYRDKWRDNRKNNRYLYHVDNNEYLNKIEQQYLEIFDIDEDYIEARYDLIKIYDEAYYSDNIDCIDRIEREYSEISKREPEGRQNLGIPIDIGGMYAYKWRESGYTDNKAFERAEYYYKYVISIDPDNVPAQSELIDLYRYNYLYGNVDNEQSLKVLEQSFKEYPEVLSVFYSENTSFDLARLYEFEWYKDKSDYTYYYMAEDAFYDAIDFEMQLVSDNVYSESDPVEICKYLVELYCAKFEFDGDSNSLNRGKSLILEQITNTYSKEISYINGDNQSASVNEENLEELGNLYYYVWKLYSDDMQYYDYAEKAFLESLNIEKDYDVLFELGSLYTDKWLLDKSDVQYKVKAVQCFDEILADENEDYDAYWLSEDVYSLLEKLEL